MTKFKGRSSTLSIRNISRRKAARRDPPKPSSNSKYRNQQAIQAIRRQLKAVRNESCRIVNHVRSHEAALQLMYKPIDSIIHFVISIASTISLLSGRVMRCLRRSLIRTVWKTSILQASKRNCSEFNKRIRLQKDSIARSRDLLIECSTAASDEDRLELSGIQFWMDKTIQISSMQCNSTCMLKAESLMIISMTRNQGQLILSNDRLRIALRFSERKATLEDILLTPATRLRGPL